MAIKKYLSLDRLTEYDALLKAKIDANDAAILAQAKTDASNQDAVVLSEAQKGIDAVQLAVDTLSTEIDGSIKSLSVSGKTITYTKNDGTTGTITTQDTNTDTKVSVAVDDSGTTALPLLFATGTSAYTGTVKMDTGVKLTPSTNTISANISGNAATATKATQDASGNTITSTYETKTNASAKLTEAKTYSDTNLATAKSYTDTAISNLINSAPSTLDTLGEIATAMEENADVVEALNDAIGTKVDKVSGKGLSTNDYTTTEKNKLAGIATGAQVNQNAFSNVVVGSTTISADSTTDTLTLVAGSNITLTPDATGDSVTIAAKDTTYTLSSFGITATASELNKLDGVTATTAELNYVDGVTSNIQTQLDGKAASSHTHNYAGSSSAGGAATSANKVNSSLTVKLNSGTTEGTNMFTFNGSAAKSINITPSAIGAADSSHTHDDRYYTETEIDTKLAGKADSSHGNHVPATQTASNKVFLRNDNTWATVTPANIGAAASSHTHTVANITDLTATADELNYMDGVTSNVQEQLDGKAASGHTHDAATTSADGFMTAAMVTKLNGIATGATKVTVDSALSISSTNPVRNSVVTTAINNATSAISANTSSISEHTTAISNLQTTVSEIQEITSAEIQALFA